MKKMKEIITTLPLGRVESEYDYQLILRELALGKYLFNFLVRNN